MDALKGRSNAAGAVVVLKEGSKSSRLANVNKKLLHSAAQLGSSANELSNSFELGLSDADF